MTVTYKITRINDYGDEEHIQLTSGQYTRLSNAVDHYIGVITGPELKLKYQQILDLLDSFPYY